MRTCIIAVHSCCRIKRDQICNGKSLLFYTVICPPQKADGDTENEKDKLGIAVLFDMHSSDFASCLDR